MKIDNITNENKWDAIEIINSLYLFLDHTDINLQRSIEVEISSSLISKFEQIIDEFRNRGLNKERARKIVDEIAFKFLNKSKNPSKAKSKAISLFEGDTNFNLNIICSGKHLDTTIQLKKRFEELGLRTKFSLINRIKKKSFQLDELLLDSYYLVFLIDLNSYLITEEIFEEVDFEISIFSERLFFVNYSGRRMNYNIEQLIFKNPNNYLETLKENEFIMISSRV